MMSKILLRRYNFLKRVFLSVSERKTYSEFQEVLSSVFYSEERLEKTITIYLNKLLPDFKVLPFKQKLYDPINKRKKAPDLAIIKKDFSEWYVVEVELSNHRLLEVIEQVESFKNCKYSNTHSDYLFKKSKKKLSKRKLELLITNQPPKLLVIADKEREEWKEKLSTYDCELCEFQIYINNRGLPVYRLSGPYPYSYTDFCMCSVVKGLGDQIEILGENGKDFCITTKVKNKDRVDINFDGFTTYWKRNDDGDRIFFESLSDLFPLDTSTERYLLTYNATTKSFRFLKG